MVQAESSEDSRRKLSFKDMDPFVKELFKILVFRTRDKFTDIRSSNEGTWPPWFVQFFIYFLINCF